MRLVPNGTVEGYNHHNEHHWRLDAFGHLCFFSADNQLSVRFDTLVATKNGTRLTGRHLFGEDHTILFLERAPDYVPAPPVPLEKRPGFKETWTAWRLRQHIADYNWQIGDYSYGSPELHSPRRARLTIGRFCSIANGVTVNLGNHRTDLTSTYPFTVLKAQWPGGNQSPDHATHGDIEIGSDVWLGTRCFIRSGLRIGHGAVVGACSVVTKDVPPYAIVAGNPARIIRYRFPPDIIRRLLDIAWWDWEYDDINAHLKYIMSEDISTFLDMAEKRLPPPPSRAKSPGKFFTDFARKVLAKLSTFRL